MIRSGFVILLVGTLIISACTGGEVVAVFDENGNIFYNGETYYHIASHRNPSIYFDSQSLGTSPLQQIGNGRISQKTKYRRQIIFAIVFI